MLKSVKIKTAIILVLILALSLMLAGCDSHVHSYGDWKYTDSVHWKECSCGDKQSEGSHSVASWTTETAATEQSEGLKSGTCSVCLKKVTQTIPVTVHSHSYGGSWKTNADGHWKECSCGQTTAAEDHDPTDWIIDVKATASAEGSKHRECSVCERVLETATIDRIAQNREVDFYAINDFHGAVDKMSQVGGYLKGISNNNANAVLINSGDMFQGSMESNSNYGKLLTDCMSAIGFDAFALGNHEFDWGLNKIQSLSEASQTPFLGANIYHWDASSRTWGDFASELADRYVIKTLDNGLTIGIIGVIGQNQITSISSNLVQTIGFKDPVPIVQELSQELRERKKCDVVVVTAHASSSQFNGDALTGYVDAVFCAHSHELECDSYSNGIPYIQGKSYGSYVSRIKLCVDADDKVTVKAQENIPFSSSWDNLYVVDELIDNSNSQIRDEANRVLANMQTSLNSSPEMARLVCRAIAEAALADGHDIALAMTNNARSPLDKGEITYSQLYQSIPFDNVVYVAKVSGADILNEARYSTNSVWRVTGDAIESNKYYFIAVIDYLLYHQDSDRNYNYFPSAFESGFEPVALENESYEVYNYRFITKDFLLRHSAQGGAVSTEEYVMNNNFNDTSLLRKSVDLSGADGFSVTNDGTESSPYTVTEAYYLIKTADGSVMGYVEGNVYSLDDSYISGGKYANLYITDGKYTLLVYRLSKGDSGAWSEGEITEGDVLLIYAQSMKMYQSTAEIANGACMQVNSTAV